MTPRIIALIPMRHQSERIPNKNYRPFAGKPLYHHIVNTVLACPLIADVVIDTDSPVIMEDASQHFPEVRLIERPEHLRSGKVSVNDVLLYDTTQAEADYYLQTHSTNPLLCADTITKAIQLFQDNYPIFDSVFSVTEVKSRLWDSLARAINHNPGILVRTQDLPPVYEENSCLYIFTRASLESRHNRIGERPIMFQIDRTDALDIDEEFDFRVAEFLYLERKKSLIGVGA